MEGKQMIPQTTEKKEASPNEKRISYLHNAYDFDLEEALIIEEIPENKYRLLIFKDGESFDSFEFESKSAAMLKFTIKYRTKPEYGIKVPLWTALEFPTEDLKKKIEDLKCC
jgi:hypothetical protein